jgi:iron complex outermembrane receptor protein
LLPSALLNDVDYSKLGRSWTQSRAIFGQATWHVNDKAAVTAGLRYTSEDKKVSVTGTTSGGVALTGALAPYAAYRSAVLAAIGGTYAAAGGVFDISDNKTTNSVSWLVNPSYKLNENILFYASASYGEKSGAANTTASPVTTTFTLPLIIAPEKSLDFEGGVKSTWLDKRLVVNVNLYDDTIRGYQSSEITSSLSLTSYLNNVGKVRLKGAEIETRFAVTPNLNVSLSGGYNDARFLSYENAPTPIELAAAAGPTLSLTGYQIPGAAKNNVQGSFDYRHDLGNGLQIYTYGNAVYHSDVSLYNPRSLFGHQKALTLANGGIGIRNERYSLVLWGKNLTDKRYYVGVGPATAANPYIGILGDPRTFGLTFSGHF